MSHKDWRGPGFYWFWDEDGRCYGCSEFEGDEFIEKWKYKKTDPPECPPDPPNPVKLLNEILDAWCSSSEPYHPKVNKAVKARDEYPELFELDAE
jgi:hypothetical protein